MCLLAADRELPEEHEDLPECLEKPQSPDLQRGKNISKTKGEQNEESREGRERSQADFEMLLFRCFQGGRPTLT